MADDFQDQVQHLETVAEDAEEGEVEETAAATDEEVAVETAQEPAADEENFNDLKDLVENDARLADDGQLADDLALADELGFADDNHDTQPESQRVDGETVNENETANEITTETGTEIETELVEKSDENLEIENGDESSRQMPVVEEGDEEEAAKDAIASETVDENKLETDEAETQRVEENEVLGEDEPIVGEGEDAGREESALQQIAEFPQGEEEESLVAKLERLSPAAENDEERELDTSVVPTARSNSLASDDEREVERIQEEDQLEGEEAGENPPGEEEMDVPQPNREQLIERYHQALAERHQLQDQNYQLQHKLSEHFRRKKADDVRHEEIRNMSDQEQRYLKFMASLDELRRQERQSSEDYKVQLDIREAHVAEKKEQVDGERRKLMEFKKQVSLSAINSRSGKPLQPKDIEQFMINENKRETEVEGVRLENIKLKNKLKKKETQLKSKEELAEGLHLIDFEQLKIENQTYNEKIEERNEELLKLRRKITSTVQVLTHLKEKLQFVQGQNHTEKSHLREVEEQVARKRDELSRLKQVRDALRIDNHKMRQNGGLLGNEPLLRDFEDSKDEADQLKERLNYLKMTHSDLSLKLNGVRRKIEDVKYPESAGY